MLTKEGWYHQNLLSNLKTVGTQPPTIGHRRPQRNNFEKFGQVCDHDRLNTFLRGFTIVILK